MTIVAACTYYMDQQKLTSHADVFDIGPLSILSTFRDPNLLACTEDFVVGFAVVQKHMCCCFDFCCLVYIRRGNAACDAVRQGLYKE